MVANSKGGSLEGDDHYHTLDLGKMLANIDSLMKDIIAKASLDSDTVGLWGKRRPLPCLYWSSIVSLLHPVVAESRSICDF